MSLGQTNQKWAYYNEHDPFAAAWLRELISDGLIAPGEVDERSIEDVTPDELRPFRQCHFFAGIGVWSLAARLAGFDDDAPLWTGSCPCQPFSAAGQGGGFADERHLWPAFHYLIEQCGPPLVVGEQVAGADGDLWLDLVSSDMDATGYAFGAAETVAAGFGAPHKRSRNYWMAHTSDGDGRSGERRAGTGTRPRRIRGRRRSSGGVVVGMADAYGGIVGDGNAQSGGQHGLVTADGSVGGPRGMRAQFDVAREMVRPGAVNGWWRDADWLRCRDEKWRAVEPASFPLADAGTFRNRVGLLRGAGNAITIGQAEAFLVAVRHALKLG